MRFLFTSTGLAYALVAGQMIILRYALTAGNVAFSALTGSVSDDLHLSLTEAYWKWRGEPKVATFPAPSRCWDWIE